MASKNVEMFQGQVLAFSKLQNNKRDTNREKDVTKQRNWNAGMQLLRRAMKRAGSRTPKAIGKKVFMIPISYCRNKGNVALARDCPKRLHDWRHEMGRSVNDTHSAAPVKLTRESRKMKTDLSSCPWLLESVPGHTLLRKVRKLEPTKVLRC